MQLIWTILGISVSVVTISILIALGVEHDQSHSYTLADDKIEIERRYRQFSFDIMGYSRVFFYEKNRKEDFNRKK